MDIADVTDRRTFDDDSFQKSNLFETDRMFSDVYCFEPGQSQTPHTHENADKVYYVLDGAGTFVIDGAEHTLEEGNAIIAAAGEEHGVRNDSDERLRTLVFMAWTTE
ncbi:cupin domain-containing protein [Salinibaculum salinum]|uniref:cupin domain-containing protein n=1 Tax=Salinibaculum salinum TaxID=3131996 RepID=UPI0030EB55DF